VHRHRLVVLVSSLVAPLAIGACSLFNDSGGLTGGSANADGGAASGDGSVPTDASADRAVTGDGGTPVTCSGPFKYPGVSSFTDDFTSGFAGKWDAFGSTCISETSGDLLAKPTPNASNEYCHVWTAAFFHLTCDSLTVKVAEATEDLLGAQTYIFVETAAGRIILLKESQGFHFSGPADSGIDIPVGAYDPAQDLWWRLREADGHLYFETAAEGTTWKTRSDMLTPISLDKVQIALGAGVYKPLTMPGQARFRCYNMPPPCE
jgi:hypothetical protein